MSDIKRNMRKLRPGDLVTAEYQRRDMIATPEAGTTIEDMLSASYWAHVAREMRAHDRIEVRSSDGTWWAELLVRVVEPLAVGVHLLRLERFEKPRTLGDVAPAVPVPPGYTLVHRGNEKWTVIRESDNEVLKKGELTREHAALWLTGHLERLGGAGRRVA